jgi:hypothetical protein
VGWFHSIETGRIAGVMYYTPHSVGVTDWKYNLECCALERGFEHAQESLFEVTDILEMAYGCAQEVLLVVIDIHEGVFGHDPVLLPAVMDILEGVSEHGLGSQLAEVLQ